jgi:hypothetical protein
MIKRFNKEELLTDFPNIKLSYENLTHKKVYNSDMFMIIPDGTKCFAWFTYINDKPTCLIMELSCDKNINNIKHVNACFSNELSYGTILYGTLFHYLDNRFFSIEDLFSYKGEPIIRENWHIKMEKIANILKFDLKQMSYNNSFVVFGLPVMCKTNEELEYKIKNVKYKINSIQYRLYNRTNNSLFITYDNYINQKTTTIRDKSTTQIREKSTTQIREKSTTQIREKSTPQIREKTFVSQRDVVFLIKPDIQNDIYNLYCLNKHFKEEIHSIANIPDYNTSVMMNNLFRFIKENNNLDALEESDDEEEFENEDVARFVNLEMSHKFVCRFNHKFKKWTPIKLADKHNKIVTSNELEHIYKAHHQNRKK